MKSAQGSSCVIGVFISYKGTASAEGTGHKDENILDFGRRYGV